MVGTLGHKKFIYGTYGLEWHYRAALRQNYAHCIRQSIFIQKKFVPKVLVKIFALEYDQ